MNHNFNPMRNLDWCIFLHGKRCNDLDTLQEKNLMMANLAETCSSAWRITELETWFVNSDVRKCTRAGTSLHLLAVSSFLKQTSLQGQSLVFIKVKPDLKSKNCKTNNYGIISENSNVLCAYVQRCFTFCFKDDLWYGDWQEQSNSKKAEVRG